MEAFWFLSSGGSVIKTLVHKIKFKGKIIGVEIDPI
jgi:hypothetical protein